MRNFAHGGTPRGFPCFMIDRDFVFSHCPKLGDVYPQSLSLTRPTVAQQRADFVHGIAP